MAHNSDSSSTSTIKSSKFSRAHLPFLLLAVVILVFTACAAYFALNTKRGIFPDEHSHFYMSTLFSSTLGIPEPSETSLRLGYSELDRTPYLYFWINGRVLNAVNLIKPDLDGWQKMVILRLTSILYSIGSILFGYWLAKEITGSKWWALLAAFMLANTLMFVFLSGGVSYDNISNMCAIAGMYFLARVLKGKPALLNSLAFVGFMAAGTMLKITILPLAVITGVLWVYYVIKNRTFRETVMKWNWKTISLGVLVIALLGLNFSVFGINLIKYRALTPSCEMVLSIDACSNNIFNERKENLGFPEEKISIIDAAKQPNQDIWSYLSDYWYGSMIKRVYGIMGHQSYFPNFLVSLFRIFYFGLFLFAFRSWNHNDSALNILILSCLGYLVVLFFIGYNAELESGFLHAGIQGRYMFPVIGVFYTVVVYIIKTLHQKRLRQFFTAAALVLFTIAGPVVFLLYYARVNGLDWFV